MFSVTVPELKGFPISVYSRIGPQVPSFLNLFISLSTFSSNVWILFIIIKNFSLSHCEEISRRRRRCSSISDNDLSSYRVKKKVSISSTFYVRLFWTKVFCTTFLCLQFGFVNFWLRKSALKLLINCWWNWLKEGRRINCPVNCKPLKNNGWELPKSMTCANIYLETCPHYAWSNIGTSPLPLHLCMKTKASADIIWKIPV